jgi:hypothetical protein
VASQAAPINVTTTGVVYTGPCTYRGLTISSTAGSDPVVVYDGVTAAGTVLAQFTLAAKGMVNIDIADGVRCTTGIYLSTAGTVQGHIRIG